MNLNQWVDNIDEILDTRMKLIDAYIKEKDLLGLERLLNEQKDNLFELQQLQNKLARDIANIKKLVDILDV